MFRHGSRSFSPAVHGRLVRRAKAMSPIIHRESQCGTVLKTVPTQANTAMSQARTSGNMSLATQVRKK
ncbi:MAG: hypothetical protein U9P07_08600 [Pseudomonadota bacterium]|nr:hypothetical protein [Pseudomonadota bacterium]